MYSYIVVDDEAIIREGLVKKIKKLDMELVCKGQAANGFEGMKLIEAEDPDIVLTDMKMPEMDGMGFLDRLTAAYPEKKVIVLSSYQDFKYMNSAIENGVVGYVLKPFSAEEIRKQLSKAINLIDRQRKMQAQVGFMQEHLSVFEKRLNNRKLLDFIIHSAETGTADDPESGKYEDVRLFRLITVKTGNPSLLPFLEKLCGDVPYGISAAALEDESQKYCYFILLMDHNVHERVLESCVMELAQKILSGGAGFVHYVCISNFCNRINEVHKLYKSCLDSLWGVRLSDSQAILTPIKRSAERIHTDDQIKALFSELRCSSDRINELLDGFFGEFEVRNASFEVLHEECCRLVDLVNEYAMQHDIAVEDIKSVFFDRYLLETKVDRIERELSGYITLIMNSVKDSCQDQERLMEHIKRYLETNYGSKITLEYISSRFFINPTYCCYWFKTKTRESFNDYLTRVRMEKAKNFLSETKMSIEEISKEVGYKNPKYFFKVFRKYSGMTPTEYRNSEKGQHYVLS